MLSRPVPNRLWDRVKAWVLLVVLLHARVQQTAARHPDHQEQGGNRKSVCAIERHQGRPGRGRDELAVATIARGGCSSDDGRKGGVQGAFEQPLPVVTPDLVRGPVRVGGRRGSNQLLFLRLRAPPGTGPLPAQG